MLSQVPGETPTSPVAALTWAQGSPQGRVSSCLNTVAVPLGAAPALLTPICPQTGCARSPTFWSSKTGWAIRPCLEGSGTELCLLLP